MKKLLILCMVGSFLSLFTGCKLDDDDYSLDNAWVGFGLVHQESGSHSFTIEMDDGEVLYPVTNSGYWNDLTDNERVLTNFTIVGNKENPDHNEYYYVRINSLKKILYKGILDITPEIEDSIGNDPIKVEDKWIKKNMLNFELKYWGGAKTHFINLVKQPGAVSDANGPVLLELRHNTNGDSEQFPLSAIVSFDLNSLKIAGQSSTQFKITAKGFDGNDFEYTGEYKY